MFHSFIANKLYDFYVMHVRLNVSHFFVGFFFHILVLAANLPGYFETVFYILSIYMFS